MVKEVSSISIGKRRSFPVIKLPSLNQTMSDTFGGLASKEQRKFMVELSFTAIRPPGSIVTAGGSVDHERLKH